MKNKEELINEIRSENKEIEDKAFELFCKEKIAEFLSNLDNAEKRYNSEKQKLDELNEEILKQMFERGRINSEYSSNKEYYIKIVRELS